MFPCVCGILPELPYDAMRETVVLLPVSACLLCVSTRLCLSHTMLACVHVFMCCTRHLEQTQQGVCRQDVLRMLCCGVCSFVTRVRVEGRFLRVMSRHMMQLMLPTSQLGPSLCDAQRQAFWGSVGDVLHAWLRMMPAPPEGCVAHLGALSWCRVGLVSQVV
jgi:hypothetical protein